MMIFHSYVSLPEGISRYSYFIFVYFQNLPEMSRYFVYFQVSVFTHFHIFEHISRYIETFPNISGDFPSPRSTKSNPNSLVVFWCSTEVWWHLSTRPLQWRNAGTPGRNMHNSPPVPSGITVEDLLTAGWVAFHDGHHGMWSYGNWWNRTQNLSRNTFCDVWMQCMCSCLGSRASMDRQNAGPSSTGPKGRASNIS